MDGATGVARGEASEGPRPTCVGTVPSHLPSACPAEVQVAEGEDGGGRRPCFIVVDPPYLSGHMAHRPPASSLLLGPGSSRQHDLPSDTCSGHRGALTATSVALLRGWLAKPANGRPLELLHSCDPSLGEKAKALMARDGMVIIVDALSPAELSLMQRTTLAATEQILRHPSSQGGRAGNRQPFRFSFGSAFMQRVIEPPATMPGWHKLADVPAVTDALAAIWGSRDYRCTGLAGDVCLPGCNTYQPLHKDLPPDVALTEAVHDAPTPPVIVVNYPMVEFTRLNGPMRCLPATYAAFNVAQPQLEDEPSESLYSTLVGCPAGAIHASQLIHTIDCGMDRPGRSTNVRGSAEANSQNWRRTGDATGAAILRDVRMWHGGTPNVSGEARPTPNALFSAPWFAGIVGESAALMSHTLSSATHPVAAPVRTPATVRSYTESLARTKQLASRLCDCTA